MATLYWYFPYELNVRKNATKKLNISTKMRVSRSYRNLQYLSDVRATPIQPGDGPKCEPVGDPLGSKCDQNEWSVQKPLQALFWSPSGGGRRRLRYGFHQSKSMSHESPQVGRRVPKASSNGLLWEVQWGLKMAPKEARWRVVKWRGVR